MELCRGNIFTSGVAGSDELLEFVAGNVKSAEPTQERVLK